MAKSDGMLSNVLGAPFKPFVITQLDVRAQRNTTGTGQDPLRTSDEILYLANKTSWVKLTSNVRFESKGSTGSTTAADFYRGLGINNLSTPSDLSQNWILQSGTSQSTGSFIDLRSGLDAYSLGNVKEYGYRPMPGLTNVVIDTKGALGSLREAVITFTVWDIKQLNIIEALFFRLGYSMLLEWGHVQYFNNVTPTGATKLGQFVTNDKIYGINPYEVDDNLKQSNNPNIKQLRKEDIQRKIFRRTTETSGNYDGMLGLVQNFNWSFNQEGGYDCTLKLIGMGAIIDSLRINLSYKLPDGLVKQYYKNLKTIQIEEAKEAARQQAIKDANALAASQAAAAAAENKEKNEGLPPVAKRPFDIYAFYEADVGKAFAQSSTDFFINQARLSVGYNIDESKDNNNYDYFYRASKNTDSNFVRRLNSYRTGLFLTKEVPGRSAFEFIPANVSLADPQPVELNETLIYSQFIFNKRNNGTNIFAQTQANQKIGFVSELVSSDNNATRLSLETTPTALTLLANIGAFRGVNPLKFYIGLSTNPNQSIPEATDLIDFVESAAVRAFINKSIESDGFSAVVVYYDDGSPIPSNGQNRKPYYFAIKMTPNPLNSKFTIQQIKDGVTQALASKKLNVFKLEETTFTTNVGPSIVNQVARSQVFNDVIITGDFDPVQPAGSTYQVRFQFVTNNSGFLNKLLPKPPAQKVVQQGGGGFNDGGAGIINKATEEQTDDSKKFSSALHAMLNLIKTDIQAKFKYGYSPRKVIEVDLLPISKTMFADGVLSGVLETTQPVPAPTKDEPFDVKKYAQKGFNSNLMLDYELWDKIPYVDFPNLCKAYGVPYKNEENVFDFPIYIKFGYLLAFLNSMCLVYDSKQDTDLHPFVYLDFNPETNLCLSLPQQLTTDPFVCLIPFEGSNDDYIKLFPEPYRDKLKTTGLTPANNYISGKINKFRNPQNNYQGKTMEILLNVDFLLEVLKRHSTNDESNAVYLKQFLDDIVQNVNKSLGYINVFRTSYRDDTNTVVIRDDQFVPGYEGPGGKDDLIVLRQNYKANAKYGQIPLFGRKSIVNQLEFKTNITSNISKTIAISAQANTGAVNSTDYSSFSYLNQDDYVNFVDVYKKNVVNANTAPTANTQKASNKNADIDNDQKQATKFNTHILSIYAGVGNFVRARTEFAHNYYISAMSGVKAADPTTVSAPFIPANISFTMDGIGGIVMTNAFTIPEDMLPRSLKGADGFTKVGFVVTGLTHNIENNRWTTSVKGQMIRLRDTTEYSAAVASIAPTLNEEVGAEGDSNNTDRNDPNSPCYVPPFVLTNTTNRIPDPNSKKGKALFDFWRPAYDRVGRTYPLGTKIMLESHVVNEGFYPGSKAWSTNNPGNIGNTDRGDVVRYDTLDEGVLRQITHLWSIINGTNPNYPKDPTLYEAHTRYAPFCFHPIKSNRKLVRKSTNDARVYTNNTIAYFKNFGITITYDMRLSEIASITR